MALTGKAQIDNVNSFYSRAFLARLLPNLVMTNFAQVRNIPANNSDVIKFRKYSSLSAATTALTEGVTPSGSQLAKTDSNATIGNYGDYVTLSDKLKMETEDPIELEATNVLSEQAALTIDELCRDILFAGTSVQYASTAAARTDITSAMKMNVGEVKEAVRTLKNNKVRKITSMVDAQTGYNTTPVDACYIGIAHPDTIYDLKADSAWVPVEKYAGAVRGSLLPFEVGKIDEVRFIETTQAKEWTDGGASNADVYGTLILGADAYGTTAIAGNAMKIIRQQLGSAGAADPLNQRATIGWKATFVAKILEQLAMVRIEHGTSFS